MKILERSALGAAIVGGGFMGSVHARALRAAGVQLIGVLAGSVVSSERAARAFGAACAYRNLDQLLDDPRVDLVHVCAPNHLHHPIARAALASGRHVVCEKPLDSSLAGARSLAVQATRSQRVAAVPFVYRFYPMVREMRARVAAGGIGRVFLVHGGYLQDWLLGPDQTDWRVDLDRGGPSRAFADIGSHWIDLLELVTGDRITSVSAQTRVVIPQRPRATGGAPTFAEPRAPSQQNGAVAESGSGTAEVINEDVAVVSLRTEAGAIGSAVISQMSAGHHNHLFLELDGTQRSLGFSHERPDQLTVGSREGRLELARDTALLSAAAAPYAQLPAGHPQGFQDCFDAFVRDLLAAIEGDAPDGFPTFAAGVRAAAVTEAVIASAASEGDWVDVPAPDGRCDDVPAVLAGPGPKAPSPPLGDRLGE